MDVSDHLQTERGNGAIHPVVPSSPELPLALVTRLEERVRILEEKIARFENAMLGAAEMCLKNPMVSMAMPKEMKSSLREALINAGRIVE